LPLTALLLLIGVGLLVFTSPSGDVKPPATSVRAGRPPRRSVPKDVPAPTVDTAVAESHREPWWLIATTFFLVIVIGMLLIFYAQIPISALI
jgi:hypothetical protein